MKYLRIDALIEFTGIKRSTIYRYIKMYNFPKPKKLGGRISVWSLSDVIAWIDSQPKKGD